MMKPVIFKGREPQNRKSGLLTHILSVVGTGAVIAITSMLVKRIFGWREEVVVVNREEKHEQPR